MGKKPSRRKSRRLNEQEWQSVRALYVGGRRVSWLAEKYGITRSAVYAKAKRDGWVRCNTDAVTVGDVGGGGQDIPEAVQGPSHDPDVQEVTPEVLQDASSRQIAQQANQLILSDHKERQERMWRLLEEAQFDPDWGCGKAGRARALADLTAVHERLVKLDRITAGMDRGDQAQVVQAVIIVPEKDSIDKWLKKNVVKKSEQS